MSFLPVQIGYNDIDHMATEERRTTLPVGLVRRIFSNFLMLGYPQHFPIASLYSHTILVSIIMRYIHNTPSERLEKATL